MRPRKVILCCNENEQELSVLKFTLATNGYKVLAASSPQEAIAIFATAPRVELVLADSQMRRMPANNLIERLKKMSPYVPMIIVGDVRPEEVHCADAVLSRGTPSQELLERIKVMSARKRGPKRGFKKSAHGVIIVGNSESPKFLAR